MKRSDALAILGLNGRESVDVLKSAYRKRAFETHPDRGGSVAEFLKVQAAYEVLLSDVRGGYTEGLDDVLAERLNDVHNAFALLDDEAGQYCQRVFEGFHKALFEVIDAYESYSQLKQDAERDITYLWSRAAERISDFLEAKVRLIADQQDKWLREYLEPSLIVAKRLNPPRWFETGYFVVGIVVAILISIGGAINYTKFLPLLVAAACSSGFLPYRAYKRKFQAKRLIKGVRLSDVQANTQVTGLAAETSWVSKEGASAGFGFLAASIGAFLGPLGSIVGGLVGSLFGWIIGESLQTRKQKLYESVLESVNEAAPKMLDELERRLRVTEEAMLTTMKENFSRNVRNILAILKE